MICKLFEQFEMKAHRLSIIDEIARLVYIGYRPDLAFSEYCVKVPWQNSLRINPSVPLFTGDN